MIRSYSHDLHERVVQAHLAGELIRSVAGRFGVSVSPVPKWMARYRAAGARRRADGRPLLPGLG